MATVIHAEDCQTGCATCAENYHDGQKVCDICGIRVDESISYGELALLTHQTQVQQFNFCLCEEQEFFPFPDCPCL